MRKSNITGWKDIYSFTLIQALKSKAYIISFIILVTIALVSMPLVTKLTTGGTDDSNGINPVQKIYVNNLTSLDQIDFSELLKKDPFQHIEFEELKMDYDTIANSIENNEKDSIIITITESANMYSIQLAKASKGPIKERHLQSLGNSITEIFENNKISALGIKEDQLSMINASVNTAISVVDVNGETIVKENTSISFSEYWLVYGILFFIMMVNIMASTQIATSVVTEKSTRVLEYLLTSVKPLALMVGKILAMLTAALLQMISMVVIFYISNRISATLTSDNGESGLSQFLPKDIFQNLNVVNLFFCLLLVVLGMIFYATLAALAGATVSRLEELNEGLTLFTFTNLIGVYIGLGASNVLMGAGVNGFVTFSFLFPLSSPFILPGAILVGKASLPIILAALALQLVFILLLIRFVAKIYEFLILHNGNTIKLKELFKISKTISKEAVSYEK